MASPKPPLLAALALTLALVSDPGHAQTQPTPNAARKKKKRRARKAARRRRAPKPKAKPGGGDVGMVAQVLPVPPSPPALSEVVNEQLNLRMGVGSVERARGQVESKAKALGGRLVRSQPKLIVVRVAKSQVGRLRDFVEGLGEVQSVSQRTNDRTAAYHDLLAKRRTAVKLLKQARAMRGLEEDQLTSQMHVERVVARLVDRISKLDGKLRAMAQNSRTAVVRITLRPNQKLAPTRALQQNLPFRWLYQMGLPRLLDTRARRPRRLRRRSLRSYIISDFSMGVARASKDRIFGGNRTAFVGGISTRGMPEGDGVGGLIGVDMLGGGATSGGFVGEATFLAGVMFGLYRNGAISLAPGIGTSGVSGAGGVPAAVRVPVELGFTTPISRYVHVWSYYRPTFIFARDSRQDGSSAAPFGDELQTGARILIGRSRRSRRVKSEGVNLGFEYGELMGASSLVFTLGFGLRESRFR